MCIPRTSCGPAQQRALGARRRAERRIDQVRWLMLETREEGGGVGRDGGERGEVLEGPEAGNVVDAWRSVEKARLAPD